MEYSNSRHNTQLHILNPCNNIPKHLMPDLSIPERHINGTTLNVRQLSDWQDGILSLWYAHHRRVPSDTEIVLFRGLMHVSEASIKARLLQLLDLDCNTPRTMPTHTEARVVEQSEHPASAVRTGQHEYSHRKEDMNDDVSAPHFPVDAEDELMGIVQVAPSGFVVSTNNGANSGTSSGPTVSFESAYSHDGLICDTSMMTTASPAEGKAGISAKAPKSHAHHVDDAQQNPAWHNVDSPSYPIEPLRKLTARICRHKMTSGCSPARHNERQTGAYPCTFCGRLFKSAADLFRHEEIIFPQQFWFCFECGDAQRPSAKHLFTRKDKMRDHIIKLHSGRGNTTQNKVCGITPPFPTRCELCLHHRHLNWKDRCKHIVDHCKRGDFRRRASDGNSAHDHGQVASFGRGDDDSGDDDDDDDDGDNEQDGQDDENGGHGTQPSSGDDSLNDQSGAGPDNDGSNAEMDPFGSFDFDDWMTSEAWSFPKSVHIQRLLAESGNGKSDRIASPVKWLERLNCTTSAVPEFRVAIAADLDLFVPSAAAVYRVKQYRPKDTALYENQMKVFSERATPSADVIRCYGSFEYTDDHGQLLHNLLLNLPTSVNKATMLELEPRLRHAPGMLPVQRSLDPYASLTAQVVESKPLPECLPAPIAKIPRLSASPCRPAPVATTSVPDPTIAAEALRCNDCEHSFTGKYRRRDLARHVLKYHGSVHHHSSSGFSCSQCDRVFKRSDARSKHERKRHWIQSSTIENGEFRHESFFVRRGDQGITSSTSMASRSAAFSGELEMFRRHKGELDSDSYSRFCESYFQFWSARFDRVFRSQSVEHSAYTNRLNNIRIALTYADNSAAECPSMPHTCDRGPNSCDHTFDDLNINRYKPSSDSFGKVIAARCHLGAHSFSDLPNESSTIGAASKIPYVRLQRTRIKCFYCNDNPDGYRGTHKLHLHVSRAHSAIRQRNDIVNDSAAKLEGHNNNVNKDHMADHIRTHGANKRDSYYTDGAHLRRALLSCRGPDKRRGANLKTFSPDQRSENHRVFIPPQSSENPSVNDRMGITGSRNSSDAILKMSANGEDTKPYESELRAEARLDIIGDALSSPSYLSGGVSGFRCAHTHYGTGSGESWAAISSKKHITAPTNCDTLQLNSGSLHLPAGYDRVAVLLLDWDHEIGSADQTQALGELQRLKDVLRTKYNYDMGPSEPSLDVITEAKSRAKSRLSPYIFKLDRFNEYDNEFQHDSEEWLRTFCGISRPRTSHAEENLLVIYYTGHGTQWDEWGVDRLGQEIHGTWMQRERDIRQRQLPRLKQRDRRVAHGRIERSRAANHNSRKQKSKRVRTKNLRTPHTCTIIQVPNDHGDDTDNNAGL
ncbi:hypothetical protein BKA63DRAFT_72982 [Paraphoma chrysanthemicola]|nr:hypothetical protein BKA63DRAFT_72982 [Paraphoma chrysanthemicola]